MRGLRGVTIVLDDLGQLLAVPCCLFLLLGLSSRCVAAVEALCAFFVRKSVVGKLIALQRGKTRPSRR
jgi:hypothetical protein